MFRSGKKAGYRDVKTVIGLIYLLTDKIGKTLCLDLGRNVGYRDVKTATGLILSLTDKIGKTLSLDLGEQLVIGM